MEQYRVTPGTRVDLNAHNPADHGTLDKKAAKETLAQLNDRLQTLQELLYAEHKHKLLVVIQAMDTGGKDGAIRHVFEGVNPQGVRVAGFKVPTEEELDHDYLWRIHEQVPGRGEIVIFNRSHYEDVLVVRVHGLISMDECRRRYRQINEFERMLAEEGTTILKFYLHIDRDEQKKRLQERLDDPTKRWKFRLGDLDERKRWDDYMAAYQDALGATSTDWAPWHIVPANHEWYRNLVVAATLVETLEGFKIKYPEPEEDLSGVVGD